MKNHSFKSNSSDHISQKDLKLFSEFHDHIGRYRFASKYTSDNSVLDLSCGSGYGSSYLAAKGAKIVIGVDISRDAIKEATGSYSDQNHLHFIVADATFLPFPGNLFESIVSLELIEHIPDDEKFLSECFRVLQINKVFVCSTPNRLVTLQSGVIPSYHIREYSQKEFIEKITNYFELITFYKICSGNSRKSSFRKFALRVYAKTISVAPWLQGFLRLTYINLDRLSGRKYYKLCNMSPAAFDSMFPDLDVLPVDDYNGYQGHFICLSRKAKVSLAYDT